MAKANRKFQTLTHEFPKVEKFDPETMKHHYNCPKTVRR